MTVLSNSSSCTELVQLLIIGRGETIWTESTFQIFLLVLLLFLTLLVDHLKFQSNQLWKNSSESLGNIQGFKSREK